MYFPGGLAAATGWNIQAPPAYEAEIIETARKPIELLTFAFVHFRAVRSRLTGEFRSNTKVPIAMHSDQTMTTTVANIGVDRFTPNGSIPGTSFSLKQVLIFSPILSLIQLCLDSHRIHGAIPNRADRDSRNPALSKSEYRRGTCERTRIGRCSLSYFFLVGRVPTLV